MNRGFVVKVKTVPDSKVVGKFNPIAKCMKPEFPYAVLSVWNQGKKNDDGTVTIVTKFLIGDQDTGVLTWVDSHAVNFVGVI
jgi:hypothetical protein